MNPDRSTLTPPPLPGGASDLHPTQAMVREHLLAPTAPGVDPPAGSAQIPTRFQEQQTVAGRYKILRFLARGGMGEVYEALDLDLGERIALKTLRMEPGSRDQAIRHFKRELSLARKVTHPNVCRTYDFFQHVGGSGESVACLSMELLSGESLAERLYREGRLEPGLVLDLAHQMAAALEAAHAVGVIHRDLKPGNVVLVPVSGEAGGLRAVVTDFGLAFSQDSADPGTAFLGTPAYMSPEQVEYRPITPRSDIYSLGLVIFEMLTGRPAFQDAHPIAAATRRLKEVPPAPGDLVPDLDPFWDGLLARCLARDPEARFADAAEFRAVLAPAVAGPARPRLRRLRVALASVCLFIAGGLAVRAVAGGSAWPGALGFRRGRPSIAVLGLRNLGPGASAWRGTALAEMLGTELALDEGLRLVPGEEVARAWADFGLGDPALPGGPLIRRLGERLGADFLVTGSFLDSAEEGRVRVDLQLVDAKSGEVLRAVKEEGPSEEWLRVVHRIGDQVGERLDPRASRSPSDPAPGLPRDPEAARAYAEALGHLRAGECLAAVPLLRRALDREPSFPFGWGALAQAQQERGAWAEARAAAAEALRASVGLPPEARLWIQARCQQVLGDQAQALQSYTALHGLHPEEPEAALALAGAYVQANDGAQALGVLGRIRAPWPPRDLTGLRVGLARAEAAWAQGRSSETRRMAELCIPLAERLGYRSLLVQLLLRRGHALTEEGELLEASRVFERARALAKEIGDPALEGRALAYAAVQAYEGGDLPACLRMAQDGEVLWRRMGNERRELQAREQGFLVEVLRGRLASVLEGGEASLAAGYGRSIRPRTVVMRTALAQAALESGHPEKAEPYVREAREVYRAAGDAQHGLELDHLQAKVHLERGELERARTLLEEVGPKVQQERGILVPEARVSSGYLELAEGRAAAATQCFQEALSQARLRQARWAASEALLGLSRARLAVGEAQEALDSARQCIQEAEPCGPSTLGGLARLAATEACIRLGNPAEARVLLAEAERVAGGSEAIAYRLRAGALKALLLAQSGRRPEALRAAESARRILVRAPGFRGLEALEARLLLTQAEAWAGAPQARRALARLREEARAAGFKGVAARAQS